MSRNREGTSAVHKKQSRQTRHPVPWSIACSNPLSVATNEFMLFLLVCKLFLLLLLLLVSLTKSHDCYVVCSQEAFPALLSSCVMGVSLEHVALPTKLPKSG